MPESSIPDNTFSIRLRAAREKRELSQSDLARKVGMHPSAIAHFEGNKRKPSFDNVRTLAQALNVTVNSLMGSAEATTAFRNEGSLSDTDRVYIQRIIDMMVSEKEGNS